MLHRRHQRGQPSQRIVPIGLEVHRRRRRRRRPGRDRCNPAAAATAVQRLSDGQPIRAALRGPVVLRERLATAAAAALALTLTLKDQPCAMSPRISPSPPCLCRSPLPALLMVATRPVPCGASSSSSHLAAVSPEELLDFS